MRRRHLALCTLVALATLGAGSAQASGPHRVSRAQSTLLTAINAARAANGVAPLRMSASLTDAATWQSEVLAQAGYIDHTSPDGSTLVDRLTRVRWRGTAAGEDLAVASRPGDAVSMWMASPGHRANLLSPTFRTVGLGLVRGTWNGRGALYVTADFGT
jgi:uncharacterized protein YkwD